MENATYKRRGVLMRNYKSLTLTYPIEERYNIYKYQQVIRSLIYTIVYIRPNLVFALSKLSQYMQNLSENYWVY